MGQFRTLVETKLREMAYPSSFNLQYFSQIPHFKDRIKYCEEKLEKIAQGTSRIVYKVDEEKVLKIAKNKKGLLQNEKEADFGKNLYGCFAEVYHADENHMWIESEIARKATKWDFQNHYGFPFEQLDTFLKYIRNQRAYKPEYLHPETKAAWDRYFEENIYDEQNEEATRLYRYLTDYAPNFYATADWQNIDNWGLVDRKGKEYMVVVDNGFDEEVQNVYSRSRRFVA